jgi:hypothetical protein
MRMGLIDLNERRRMDKDVTIDACQVIACKD